MKILQQKHLFILFFGMFIFLSGTEASQKSQACMFYETFIVMDMEKWREETEKLEQVYLKTENSLILKDLLKAQYGYLGYLVGEEGGTKKTKEWIVRFEKYIDILFSLQTDDALSYCYQASMYAYKIVAYPATAIVNGRRCINAIEKSIELAPDSYLVWSNRAIIETNIPSLAGADYRKAITFYKKSYELMQKNEQEQCTWILLNTLVWKAKCYEKLNENDLAISTYERILQIAPAFDSVQRWRDRLAGL